MSNLATVDRSEFESWYVQSVKGPRHDGSGYKHTACGSHARMEHNGSECSSCRNWGGCGGDCDVSGVYCESCGVRADLV